MTRLWMIRNDEFPASELVAGGFISIGWDRVGDLVSIGDDQVVIRRIVREMYPEDKEGSFPVSAGVLRRFAFDMREGDAVVAPDRQTRLMNIGILDGPYRFVPEESAHLHRRAVKWLVTEIPRSSFTQPALNEIGSALTLIEVRRHVNEFIRVLSDAGHPVQIETAPVVERDRGEAELRNLSDEFLRAMRGGDSVFTPGRRVWAPEVADELLRAFVERPDLSGRSFEEKLDDQLAGASDDAIQLFAELWCMSLAPLADYTPARKRQLLTWVLAKMSSPVPLPPVVDTALEAGAFSGGVAFKTRRPFQITLLIKVAGKILALADQEREATLADPEAFEGLLASIKDPNEPAQRCALRWFLFPGYFLPIVSDKHRKALRDAFTDLLDGTSDNLDGELNQIRNALSEGGTVDVDFYRPPLLDRWDSGRTLTGIPATPHTLADRNEFRTPRYAVASAAIDTLGEGEWTTYADVGAVAGLIPAQVGAYIDKVHHDAGHRVIKIDGSTDTVEQREALEAEGIQFDHDGLADPGQKVTKEDLHDRLEVRGLLPKVARRAWLVRGSSVNGRDLVPDWLARGQVSLAATTLREIDPGIDRDHLKPIVEEDYAHASYAARAEKLDEFHAFLTRMQPGHLVVTVDQGRIHLGEITGDVSHQPSIDGGSTLVRGVEWRGTTPVDSLPGDVSARIKVQRDVLDLTQNLDLLEKLFVADEVSVAVDEAEPVVLLDATDKLAEDLHVDRTWLQECVELLRDRPQMIFYGPPGTGKTYIAQALAEHLAGENVRLVQFHPSYSYEDFFEGYRPTSGGGFELRPGPMRRIVDQAVANPRDAHVLIIDEINRGNLAKVFGELYFLLEYRDRNVELLYGDGDFSLPANVFLIGTMNTADRSIALVDAAMRRRFAFVALHPSEPPIREMLRTWLRRKGRPERVADLLDELNAQIADPDFKVGPSYFMRDKAFEAGGLERVWRTTILPLLEEHHFGEMNGDEVKTRYGYAAISERMDRRQVETDASPRTD